MIGRTVPMNPVWTSGTKPNPRLSTIGRTVPLVRLKNYAQRNYMAKTIVMGVDEVCNSTVLPHYHTTSRLQNDV